MTLDDVRQPMPVKVILEGEPEDVARYRNIIIRYLERNSYDGCTISAENVFTIYPRAVND